MPINTSKLLVSAASLIVLSIAVVGCISIVKNPPTPSTSAMVQIPTSTSNYQLSTSTTLVQVNPTAIASESSTTASTTTTFVTTTSSTSSTSTTTVHTTSSTSTTATLVSTTTLSSTTTSIPNVAYGIVPVGALEDTSWNIHSPTGFGDIEVNIDPYYDNFSSSQAYFYSLFVNNFVNASTGAYAGLQTNGSINSQDVGKMLIFSVWGATQGISVPGGTGQPFGGEGTGYSERVPYDWLADHVYNVKIYLSGTSPDGNLWGASVTDLNTSQVQPIGLIYVPVSYGNITVPVTFDELYVNNPPAACNAISPSEVSFTNLSADNGDIVATAWNHYVNETIANCSNYIWQEDFSDGYISAGGVFNS